MHQQSNRTGKHGPEPRPLAERFWEKVDRRGPEECWPWMASRTKRGYGNFRIGPRQCRANRVAYELAKGPLAPGQNACHSCDNPPCCNPAHLWAGTDAQNHADRNQKGRQAKGERSGVYTHPEARARGTRNGTYTHPESRARSDRNGQRVHPERTARGDRSGARLHAAKLSMEAANVIRALRGKEMQKVTAQRYGVSREMISRIQCGRRWIAAMEHP